MLRSSCGSFVLLEAFDESDLGLAASLVQQYRARVNLLVGVNCRDLATLQVVPGRLEALARWLPPGVPRVAESGVQTVARNLPSGENARADDRMSPQSIGTQDFAPGRFQERDFALPIRRRGQAAVPRDRRAKDVRAT